MFNNLGILTEDSYEGNALNIEVFQSVKHFLGRKAWYEKNWFEGFIDFVFVAFLVRIFMTENWMGPVKLVQESGRDLREVKMVGLGSALRAGSAGP